MSNNTDQYSLFPEVFVQDRHAVCSSLDVAAHFGKRHKNVLRDIENLASDYSEEFRRLNFEPASYLDEQKKPRPAYNLTRDGFMVLAMGFTGKEAAQWKERYIAAFNRMEAALAEAVRREAELEGRLEAARKLAGNERAGLAEQAMLLLEEGVTQAGAARLLRVSRHVVYRLRRRFGFLAEHLYGPDSSGRKGIAA